MTENREAAAPVFPMMEAVEVMEKSGEDGVGKRVSNALASALS